MADVAYPDAPVIPVILDNPVQSTGQALNIHRMVSLYENFPAAEARLIVRRLDIHHAREHVGWLNIAGLEFSVLTRDRLRVRHGDRLRWLEPSRPVQSGATSPKPPSTGVSAARMPAPNSVGSIPAILKLIRRQVRISVWVCTIR